MGRATMKPEISLHGCAKPASRSCSRNAVRSACSDGSNNAQTTALAGACAPYHAGLRPNHIPAAAGPAPGRCRVALPARRVRES
jgi:hypothetical protein